MKIYSIILGPLFFALAALASEGPLVVSVNEKWAVDYKKGSDFYSLTRTKSETALLMFSRWPAPGNRDQIPVYLDQTTEAFLEELK